MKKQIIFCTVLTLMMMVLSSGCVQPPTVTKEVITSPDAPQAIGPYSQAIRYGGILFCSGQIPIDPRSNEVVRGDIQMQTRQVLENLGAVLKAAQMDYTDVVQLTVFLSDLNNYAKMNEVYAQYFKEKPPARAAVQVARLPKDVDVEISLIAIRSGRR